MDYFRKYLAPNDTNDIDTGIETIEKLVDRLTTSTLIDDRRDAIRALKSLSKKFRLEVGTQAMHQILNMLEYDKDDCECAFYAIETLYNIMNEDFCQEDIETNRLVNIPTGLGSQFTEMFITKPNYVELILNFIEDTDFNVRRISIQLIHVCLINMLKETQDAILKCPIAISKIVDLLSDSNEVIRNDSLLLINELVKNNGNIQKILAFENAFDHLLTIVSTEGESDGGVIVEDCLKIISALIENNPQNRTLFREGSFIKRLKAFFELLDESNSASVNSNGIESSNDTSLDRGWTPQKVANVQLMLQIVRRLVSPYNNKSQATASCQLAMFNCGLFQQLCRIVMSSGIPTEILTEVILAVAESMRGCQPNQQFFCYLMAPSEPALPAVNVLILSMVKEDQSFILRCAALYCFQCFLWKHPLGQNFIIQTLLPKTADVSNVPDQFTSGKMLCMGLFSSHSLSVWFAAVSLMHCIHSNNNLKEELLKVQLAVGPYNTPLSFLQKCCNLFSQGFKSQLISPQAKIGLLMMLCSWLNGCPNAVTRFLAAPPQPSGPDLNEHSRPPSSNDSSPSSRHNNTSGQPSNKSSVNLTMLISEMTGSDNAEPEIITRGLCVLLIGICIKYNNNTPNSSVMDGKSILQLIERRFDKDVFIDNLNSMTKTEAYMKTTRHMQPHFNEASDVLFDYEFTRLFSSLEYEVLQIIQGNTHDTKNPNFSEHEKVVVQYKDLIKSQDDEIQHLKQEISRLSMNCQHYEMVNFRLEADLQTVKDQYALLKVAKSMGDTTPKTSSIVMNDCSTNCDFSYGDKSSCASTIDLRRQLDEAVEEIRLLKSKDQSTNENFATTHNDLELKIEQLSKNIKSLERENSELKQSVTDLNMSVDQNEIHKKLLEDLRDEHNSLKSEHDDLLILLSDQEDKIKEYKIKLGFPSSNAESSDDNVD